MTPERSDSPKPGSPEWWDVQLLHEIALHEQMLEQLVMIRTALTEIGRYLRARAE